MKYKRLGDLLVSVGVITEKQLEEALEYQKSCKIRLGEALIAKKFITEQQLIETLTIQLGIEFVDIASMSLNPSLAGVLPKSIAKQYQICPVKIERDTLYIATSDPLNFYALEDARKAAKMRVVPMIATAHNIDRAIMNLYVNEGASRAIEEMRKYGRTEMAEATFTSTAVENDSNAAPTIRLVNSILEQAVVERASDIHLEPAENELRVRMRIDGLMMQILTVPKDLQNAVISRLKVMGSMDISEKKIPQDGRATVTTKQKEVDLRMSTLPTIFGEKFVMRLLDKDTQFLSKTQIGLSGPDSDKYDALLRSKSGVILVVGPTGSGKSSTLSTMIHQLNDPSVNLVTLEDPVEYQIDGITQVQINEKTGMTFANGLRSILRQDPDIISIGEIRDGETAEIAMRSAITGHMVLSTIHTSNAVSAIDRLKDIGVAPYLISGALRGVISQRLVRRICPNCKTSYKPEPEEVSLLRLNPGMNHIFYKGKGCPMCFHTGYRGRIGVFEVLSISPELRTAINEGSSKTRFQEIINRENFVSIQKNAVRLVYSGVTTAEEAIKVIESADL